MKVKKIICIILFLLLFWQVKIFGATEEIIIQNSGIVDRNLVVKVKSDSNIKSVKIYRKSDNGKYNLFFSSTDINEKEKSYLISEKRLSTEKETFFKIVVEDEKGNECDELITAEKLPEPSVTPSPSVSPSSSNSPTISPTTSSSTTPTTPTTPTTQLKTVKFNVTANKENISKNTFSKQKTVISAVSLKKGSKISLKNISKIDNNSSVTWKSKDTSIVSVSSTGILTARKVGTTEITATTKSSVATMKVTVTKSGYDIFYDSNGKKITDTNTILTILGLIGKKNVSYFIEINIGKNTSYKKCTCTVYTKDANGKYVIPVRHFLVGVFRNANKFSKSKIYYTDNQTSHGSKNAPKNVKRFAGWDAGPYFGWTPYWVSIPSGYFHGLGYGSGKNNVKLSKSAYNAVGTYCSNGCVRVFWQDLAWLYYNCPVKTPFQYVSTEGPFGIGAKRDIEYSKFPGVTKAKKLYGIQ